MRIDHMQLEVLHARAHRERAEAVYALIIAPLLRLFRKPPPRKPASARKPALQPRIA